MMEFLIYDAKVALALLVFYLLYRFLLKKETLHRFNRMVLVGTALVSFLLPLCIITIHKPAEIPASSAGFPASLSGLPTLGSASDIVSDEVWWNGALMFVFCFGVALVLVRVAVSILSIVKVIGSGKPVLEEDGSKIIVTERDIDPFSWMKYIVLSKKDWEMPNKSILIHEKAHVAYRHSQELLLVDILSALQWFNPAIWMLRSDLRELHEYEADDAVLRSGVDVKEYQYLLIRKAVSKSGYSVANSFNHSILKNRITMMSKSKSPRSRGWRVLYMLPLVCLTICLQARTVYVPSDKGSENKPAPSVLQEVFVCKYADSSAPVTKEEHLYGLPEVEGLVPADEVDVQAVCKENFAHFLAFGIMYPEGCTHEGTVQVSFVVDERGNLSHVSIVQGVCEELDNAVLDQLRKSPDWQAAVKDGHPVAVRLIQPVVFEIRSASATGKAI